MLEAERSLSPKALERIRRFRSAVRTLALYRAKQAVREDIRAQGLKLGEFVWPSVETLDAQHAALTAAGAERVYAEKISGAVTDRKARGRAIAALAEGDTLIVTKLDRLARSTPDLLNTLDAIGKAGATFKSLGDPWCDTTTPHGRLMLTVLGGKLFSVRGSRGSEPLRVK